MEAHGEEGRRAEGEEVRSRVKVNETSIDNKPAFLEEKSALGRTNKQERPGDGENGGEERNNKETQSKWSVREWRLESLGRECLEKGERDRRNNYFDDCNRKMELQYNQRLESSQGKNGSTLPPSPPRTPRGGNSFGGEAGTRMHILRAFSNIHSSFKLFRKTA